MSSSSSLPLVFAVVLNWNNAQDTAACLASLLQLEYPNCNVLVVDNGSCDTCTAHLRQHFPFVTILELEENLGYAGGNNIGIEYALKHGGDYVWLLNDDVTVARDSLSALISVATAEPKAGFLGPKVYVREDPQRLLSAGGEFGDNWHARHRGIGQLDQGQFDAVSEVDHASGCALLASRRAIEVAGTLDELFFAYYEDVEWCYRGRRSGFKVLFVPRARVWHPDTRHRDKHSPFVTYYVSRNYLLFCEKHRLGTDVIARGLMTYLLRTVSWSFLPKWRHKRRQRDALLRGIADFLRRRFGRAEWQV